MGVDRVYSHWAEAAELDAKMLILLNMFELVHWLHMVRQSPAIQAPELPGSTYTVRGTEMRKLLIAAASMVVLSGAAHAGPTMLLEISTTDNQGTITCSITDVVNALPSCTNTGATTFSAASLFNGPGNLNMSVLGSVGGWSFGMSTMTSEAPGAQTGSTLFMNFATVRKGENATGNLIFSLSGDGFTLPSGPVINMNGSVAITSGLANVNSVSGAFASQENGAIPLAAPTVSDSCVFTPAPMTFGCGISPQQWTRTGSASFSMRDVVTFDLAANGQAVGGSSSVSATNGVPEPMTAALVGLGLFGAAFFSRRRAAKQA